MPPAPTNITLAPAGQPKILVGNAAVMTRLRTLLASNDEMATRWKSIVDNNVFANGNWDIEPSEAALMSQLTGNATYCTYAVSKTDQRVQGEEALIAANRGTAVADDDYLHVGGIVGSLAMVYDWCRPQMTSAMRTRWYTYANQAVFNAWYRHTTNMPAPNAFYGNNITPPTDDVPWGANNPQNNYYYSFLRATMLLGLGTRDDNPMAGNWLGQFRTAKIGAQLLPLFNARQLGGGSREGTGYGTALRELFELYYLWEASTGERIADLTPHTKASLPQLMHNIVPTLDAMANIGDQARDSAANVYDYHLHYLKVLLQLYPTDRMSGYGRTLVAQAVPGDPYGNRSNRAGIAMRPENYLGDFLYHPGNVTAPQPLTDVFASYFAPGNGTFATRSSWNATAAYGNFLCGPNPESHAHRDRGSFTIFRGNWLALDANAQSGSGLMQWGHAHNLVRFERNGADIEQLRSDPGCQMRALADRGSYSYASANVLPVFGGNSAVVRDERRFLFIRPGVFVVFDAVQSAGSGMRRIWTLNVPGVPTLSGNTVSYVQGANRLDAIRVSPSSASVQAVRWSTAAPVDWSETFPPLPPDYVTIPPEHRIDVAHASGDTTEFLHVLSTNGAVVGAPVAANTAGQVGTQFDLSDGRTVIVRFNVSGDGGTITIRQGATVLLDEALPTTVQTLPLFVN